MGVMLMVLALLEWTQEDLMHVVRVRREQWVRELCGMDRGQAALLLESKTFTGWWWEQWMLRDEAFLKEVEDKPCGVLALRREYFRVHNAKWLSNGMTVDGRRMEHSYAGIVGLINKGL